MLDAEEGFFNAGILFRETLEETGIDQEQIKLYDNFAKVCEERATMRFWKSFFILFYRKYITRRGTRKRQCFIIWGSAKKRPGWKFRTNTVNISGQILAK